MDGISGIIAALKSIDGCVSGSEQQTECETRHGHVRIGGDISYIQLGAGADGLIGDWSPRQESAGGMDQPGKLDQSFYGDGGGQSHAKPECNSEIPGGGESPDSPDDFAISA